MSFVVQSASPSLRRLRHSVRHASRFVVLAVLAVLSVSVPSRAVAGGSPATSFTEFFEGSQGDLAFSSVTFTPDGGPSYYRACRQAATAFPVDPAGGSGISMNDDDVARVDLADGRSVSLYGATSRTLFVGSNGYVTFAHDDKEYEVGLGQHFDLPRVSAMFVDLDPRGHDSPPITWKQLVDRFVVTWKDIAAHGALAGNRENFQAELFFDGRIRLTWLEVHAPGALVGLSRGRGIPADFAQTDFSALPDCPSCGHEVCEAGDALASECGACTYRVCGFDSFCCTKGWDAQCIEEARCFCPQSCRCGDGALDGLCEDPTAIVVPETCDDANLSSGDGCGADCQLEACGNTVVDPSEQCDDGNNTDGDGCSSDCKLQGGYCSVTFGFDDFTNPVGELVQLQWRALYPESEVLLATDVAAPACRALVPVANLDWSEGQQDLLKALDVSVGLGDKPVHGPIDIATCTFRLAEGLDAIGKNNVVPNLTSSSFVDSFASLQPRVSVTAVACGILQVCGDGAVQGIEDCDDGNQQFASGERCTAACTFVPCGKPTNSAGENPLAKDALFTLKAAVGQGSCVLEVCDVDNNGKVLASDALRILRSAVGQDIALVCPA